MGIGVMALDMMQLEAFVQVARRGTISAAAEALHLTQPALSMKIKNLENSLGVELLRRTNRGIELTEAGRVAFKEALKVLRNFHDLTTKMDAFKENLTGTLVIGATTTIGGYALPCSIFAFREKYRGARVNLKVGNTSEIVRMVKSEEIVIGLVEGDISDPSLVTRGIAEDELLLVAHPESPWVGRTSITLQEFARLPLIIREQGSGTRQTIEAALKGAGLTLDKCNVVLELGSIDAIKAAVEAGRGVSLLSSLALRKELRMGTLVSLSVEGLSLRRQFYLVHLKGRALSALEKEFVRFIRTSSRRQFC